MNLVTPCAYQGGKQSVASKIIDIIQPNKDDMFFDVCCGSGAISIELINRGHNVNKIRMIDKGPWGLVWKMIGNGTFNINKFYKMCEDIPKDRDLIQDYIKELSKKPAHLDTPYIFLILQANSFGGKAIWINKENDKFIWKNTSFRNHWKPTSTSNCRSPILPMHPEPHKFAPRMELICNKMKGVQGILGDIQNIDFEDGIIYIDPPYENLTSYGHKFNILKYIDKLKRSCYVSEARPLNGATEAYQISHGYKKGGISGDRRKLNEEWLNFFK
jgi:site-specific DNA-adenine methylase